MRRSTIFPSSAAWVPQTSCTPNACTSPIFTIQAATPLSRIVRKECRRRGIRHLTVLYSDEEPVRTAKREPGRERTELGTASFMPPIMGQMIAGEVIRRIAGIGC